MNKNQIVGLALAGAVLLFTASCKEEKRAQKPVINMLTPAANDTLSASSDSIHIEFWVTGHDKLEDVTIRISDSSGAVVFADVQHPLNTSYYYNHSFKPTGIVSLKHMIHTVSVLDYGENVSTEMRHFYVKP